MADDAESIINGLDSVTVEDIASRSLSGRSNEYFKGSPVLVAGKIDEFMEETNNWFEILDVRIYRDFEIGLPCRYRWTIRRWAYVDMDSWLLKNGWHMHPHTMADSDKHKENELEARYVKQYGKFSIYANFYVEFTDDVFEALNEGTIENLKMEDERRSELIEQKMEV